MRQDPDDVATLLEALPYIREFHGQTVVIKYGGAAMDDPALREEFARDVVLLKYVGLNPIVVHGGGPEITAYMERLDHAGRVRRRACACRDAATVEVAKMVLVGKVNKDIVLRLNRHGQPAVGLSRRRRRAVPRRAPDRAGRRGHRLRRRASSASTSTCSTTSPRTTSRSSRRSAPTARATPTTSTPTRRPARSPARCGAYKVMFLTDVAGWLRDPADPDSVVSEAGADEVEAALDGIAGGMRPKLAACLDAIHGGVHVRAHRRRARPALAAARAVHRRGHRHEDPGGA